MAAALDIHFVLAYLVALCALVFSWNALGRRVVNVVLGLQVLAGLAVAGMLGANHVSLPKGAAFHIAAAIVALICYGLAARFGKSPRGGRTALALSILGLLSIAAALYLGVRMQLTGAA
ncbi:MAG TPA: hypothetical protein VIJ77_09705 [Candidatus Tumulicola sp.]